MDKKWNVYAWYEGGRPIRVGYHVSTDAAYLMVAACMNRGLEWDAYMVKASNDSDESNKSDD